MVMSSCSLDSHPSPRLVILYATCSVNKDFLAPYDEGVQYTPFLREFAKQSLVFPRHQTESGQSGTAFASIFSGAQAPVHGIYRHPTPMSRDVLLITEAFVEADYDVHVWLAHGAAAFSLRYAQGVPPGNSHQGIPMGREPALHTILERLESDPDYRALIVTNFTVTHSPYDTRFVEDFCEFHPAECSARSDPEEFDRYAEIYLGNSLPLSYDLDGTRRELELSDQDLARLAETIELLYKSNVLVLDRLFQRMISVVDARVPTEESLIAFTADHGEVLYRPDAHFFWSHGFQLAPEVLNVPFLLRGPGVGVAPGVYPGVTRSIDVFPTLAALSKVPVPEFEGRGVDLSRAVRGLATAPNLLAFSHTALFIEPMWRRYGQFEGIAARFSGMDPKTMWVGAREGDLFHQLTRPPGGEWRSTVIDLEHGPAETLDPRDERWKRHREVVEKLRDYKRQLVEDFERRRGVMEELPHDRARERLRALGYIE
jgi:arylsulfatase A-like enzyme